MANQLSALLAEWYPRRDDCDWVLGTVYKTEGPCYRKAGAMMLFNGLGQQFGMLSGGCLESDIQTHARKVMQTAQALTLCYDGSDEDDLAFQLGIGCGGTVYVLLQAITQHNNYQQLDCVYQALKQGQGGRYIIGLPDAQHTEYASEFEQGEQGEQASGTDTRLQQSDGVLKVEIPIKPDPHLLVVGGGIDARPVVSLAMQLGWKVSLWDPRPANGRREFFLDAEHILAGEAETLPTFIQQQRVNAAVLMTHNVVLDAAALWQLKDFPLGYLALLGPVNRKQKVLEQAGVAEEQLKTQLHGPAGLDIGGDLPESIALSILSQCHAALMQPERLPRAHHSVASVTENAAA